MSATLTLRSRDWRHIITHMSLSLFLIFNLIAGLVFAASVWLAACLTKTDSAKE